jgi:cobyrinic acid a,c-diamide synthase
MPGLILAAPTSGAGKTTVTLALLRLLNLMGHPVRAAKSGPDYIDPRFHEAACEAPCLNLDAWAMPPERITSLAAGDELLVIEGAMGLFDGAPPDGRGAVADLARLLKLPVILVVDASHMAQSVAPLVAGFAGHDPEVQVAGVILNRVGSPRHARMLRMALEPLGLPVLAAIPRHPDLVLPSRHLGLVQAGERPDLDPFLDRAAAILAEGVPEDGPPDLATLLSLAAPLPGAGTAQRFEPPMQTIAVARDEAFAFSYPHMLNDWRDAGAEITFFSPLNDDPVPTAGFVFLPGGYPELHAGRLAANGRFLTTLRNHGERKPVYGECGGFMVLGDVLTDADGVPHQMAGLLNLATSFKKRQMQLGYRRISADKGPFKGTYLAHEFHYATVTYQSGDRLFQAEDAEGTALPAMGLRENRAYGSFAHIIDRA